MPVISPTKQMVYPPCILSKSKCNVWSKVKSRSVIKYTLDIDGEKDTFKQIKIVFNSGQTCFVYSNSTAWMTKAIFTIELRRLSKFLRTKFKNERFCLLQDNFPSHLSTSPYDNIVIINFRSV